MSWTLIEHQALSSSAASVTLGSGGTIPQTYKTLKLVFSVRTDSSAVDVAEIRPNAATTNLSARQLYGTGTAAASNTTTVIRVAVNPVATTSNVFGNGQIDFPNYTSTTTNKPTSADSVTEENATGASQVLGAGLWSNTSAITSIVFTLTSNNMVSGSTFTLYGLA